MVFRLLLKIVWFLFGSALFSTTTDWWQNHAILSYKFLVYKLAFCVVLQLA